MEDVIAAALARLDLDAKVTLLTGADMWALPAAPEIGLGRLVMSDGPVGVRGEIWDSPDPSVNLPSPTALAATWDVDLAERVGALLAQEARRKGVHVLLAPTVNLHRSPLGGRHFECYSEDPLLTGAIGAGYVRGVQGGGVAATVKHFLANDSETERMTVDVRVSERALRELYLAPFELIVEAGVWAVMASYNRVNGITMTEHAGLLRGVLKGEWGFDGAVVSDWTATRSTEGTALGGLDLCMPGPVGPWGAALAAAVRDGRVPEEVVDEQVRRVLRLAARVGVLDGVSPTTTAPPAACGAALAREVAARSFVLLRNDGVLPLAAPSLALIGAGAAEARTQGGGSAQVRPAHVVSPLDGLRAALGAVSFALGTDPRSRLSPLTGDVTVTFADAAGAALATEKHPNAGLRWFGALPADPADLATVTASTTFTPAETGAHQFSVNGIGRFALVAAGTTVLDEDIAAETGDPVEAFLLPPQRRATLHLTAGVPVELTLTHHVNPMMANLGFVAFSLGHAAPTASQEDLFAEAVRAASAADVAVVVVGTTDQDETEGVDRQTLALPGRQDELVARIAAANPRTVVVVNSGSPVLMPWAGDVSAILLTWFGGQEFGAALADVLLGAVEPGGRLPTTWPAAQADCPVLEVRPDGGVLPYTEDNLIGYRAWQRSGAAPAYWFGHGLGYTTWAYDAVRITTAEDGWTAHVTVRNTGDRAGREVVQVYLGTEAAGRPRRWLAGFVGVTAEPGESVQVPVAIPRRAVRNWDGGWVFAPGRYTVEVGRSVADLPLTAHVDV